MCGILAVLGIADNPLGKRPRIIELSRRLRHRGPDWSGLHHHQNCYLAHERLAIVDPASGDQPLFNEDKTIVVTVNGEIYNHKELRERLKSHNFRTGSDCEVIAHLYEEYGEEFVNMLDGMFSFVLLDTRDNSFIAARDAIVWSDVYQLSCWKGLRVSTPLFSRIYLNTALSAGSIWFASEMKALSDDCERFMSFLPGHIYSSKLGGLRRWYNPPWFAEQIPSAPYEPLVLRKAFEKAVVKRLMTDVPFGVLLSGGLDSSLVASVASRYLADSEAAQWGSQLHTFCIGLKGSPDLKAAKEVADYLGTRHHEFHFTVQEGIDALAEVIYHIETYDVTTIRASTPMFLMSRKIRALGVKMVISGEGSDEIFGGYLYFHKAPNKEEFHQETCRKIKALHLYDCLRANKSTSAWGVEARVPFLDKEFINVAMAIDPEWKMIRHDLGRIEKWILRNAFDDKQNPYLPKHILYRQKEQFSDGVGYSWIDGLKDHASQQVTDAMLANASFVYPENTPTTKEGGPSVACSTAKAVEWDAAWSKNLDPSGRAALGVHVAAYDEAKAPAVNGPSKKE
ncbi:Asparagine synthetase [glutamine-hydrolyzing] 3 [Sesamum angolense]|uniref:Asparagine synthetase [glutamine-hydrolyzing] n=1 Tax=Sesamum angolense TaxID=2727404 RepID=A0AAE1XGX6_9LAMI|nr:Asparagine synthetase [glutamine-hydrolyzing] 3 [Sesamum angolense]